MKVPKCKTRLDINVCFGFFVGLQALGDYIHSKGLKYGLYSNRGFWTCQHFPSLLDNEVLDINTMAGWGIDFLKNDGCYITSPNIEGGIYPYDPSAPELYERVGDAILATGREIVHNIKGIPGGGASQQEGASIANLQRCGGDIGDSFGSATGEFFGCEKFQNLTGRKNKYGYYWNDPDSLEVRLLLLAATIHSRTQL
jgi:alpha-galactosidase